MERVPGRRDARLAVAIVTLALMAACLDAPGGGGDDDGDGSPVQLLANPDFEAEATGWTADGAVEIGTTEELGLPPSEAGPTVAVLGRQDNQMDRLVQELVVPESTRTLELSGMRCFDTGEGFDRIYDRFTVVLESIDDETTEVLVDDSNLDATPAACDWLPFGKTAEDHAGEEIRLVIEAVTDTGTRTSFAIDGLALTARP